MGLTRNLVIDGLWKNNPGLVQLLGLCPLLAVTTSLTNGLGMGIATTLVLCGSNLAVALIRNLVRDEIRIPVFVLVIASLVTTVELAMNAWFHDLFRVLGIFIPLIVTNCIIIGRAEAFASRNRPSAALLDGLMMGTGFTLVLVVLGALREIIGQGTLLAGSQMLFGTDMSIRLFDGGFLLALLPPGAFIGLGLLVALKNVIDARMAAGHRREPIATSEPASQPG
ncbi:MAG: electron transport complex subunit E [Gammaproteobacteria bacterium]